MDNLIDRVASTAFLISHIRAAEEGQPEPLFHDPYAQYFHHEPTAQRIAQFGARVPIFFTCLRVRTRWGDDLVSQELDRGTTQVVTLGAGFDCRALRFGRPGVTFFEVDRAEVLAFKAGRLADAGVEPAAVAVAADYTTWDLIDGLVAAGLDPTRRTLILWEGNTYYLPPEQVIGVLDILSSGLREPHIAFDYFGSAIIEGRSASPTMGFFSNALKKMGAPWQGWIDNLREVASAVDLAVVDDRPVRALASRYVPQLDLGADLDVEMGFGVLAPAAKWHPAHRDVARREQEWPADYEGIL